ncbi:PREDICTED: uncharacterized protein LOC105565524 [Vollenhovia emeryi]|uniref:uncharacterized protein LOC105565524 n=1 Tax=Vollenhovia emeryi TaxID=411798 RepID=UPI0005F56F47|nr:PREDICTED: uncharacterized protein LOC105565524 [Vollenhovia emeryi]
MYSNLCTYNELTPYDDRVESSNFVPRFALDRCLVDLNWPTLVVSFVEPAGRRIGARQGKSITANVIEATAGGAAGISYVSSARVFQNVPRSVRRSAPSARDRATISERSATVSHRNSKFPGNCQPLPSGEKDDRLRRGLYIGKGRHGTRGSRRESYTADDTERAGRRRFPANNSDNDTVGASPLAMENSIRGVIGVSNSIYVAMVRYISSRSFSR